MQIKNQKNIPDKLTVKIEKLSNLGLGIAKVNDYVIFVKNTCPDDIVKIKITKKNKNFANAVPVEFLEESPHRCKSFCPMQKICGSCQLGYVDYDYQLVLKKEIVKDVMHSIYGEDAEVKDVVPSPQKAGYRRKIQYQISETKESKRILAGYYKKASHELVNIKYCPVQPAICDDIIDFIRKNSQELNISGYIEKNHSGILRNVVIRSSSYKNSCLVILVINEKTIPENIRRLASNIFNCFNDVVGVCVNFNDKKTNLILGEYTEKLEGEDFIEEELCGKVFRIGADTFFQINPPSANNIFKYIKNYISENFDKPTILDAYAGIAAFGICLSETAKEVTCVEEVTSSVELARSIITDAKITNINLYNLNTEEFCKSCLRNGKKFDVAIIDPPRKGCSEESLNNILKLAEKKLIYVSCNPATLARDLKYLKTQGCKFDFIQPFDMFPQTYHIENVVIVTLPHGVRL